MKKSLWLCLFMSILLMLPMGAAYAAKEEIQLQLKWKHAFQFAGYYMAKEKGFYAAAGLNVNIIEGAPGISFTDHVLTGAGYYAVTDTGALLERSAGAPIQVLAAIFQHSPLALAVRKESGINTFADLRGKRIMMQPGNHDAVILAAIHRAGLSKQDFIRQDNSYNILDLVDGNTDAFSVYVTDQPHQLKEMGVAYNILSPTEYDLDFYGDILITSEQETGRHLNRTKAFTAASIQGWEYALTHIPETIALIQAKYNTQNLSTEQLYFEAHHTSKAILGDEIELGYMSDFRWRQIAKVYENLGFIAKGTHVDNFIFVPQPSLQEFIVLYKWQMTIAVLLLLSMFLFGQRFALRRMVRVRTEELREERELLKASKQLQKDISDMLEMVASEAPITKVFEAITFAFEKRYPNMRSSILLLKDGRLYKGAAPSLPDAYNAAIEGLEIGPKVGSCGTASYLKKRVVVEDIATDELWAPYTGLAMVHDLRACWSEPILNSNGDVLGTFAMYYDHVRKPSEMEIEDISNAAKLAGIAIERGRTQDNLRKLSRATEQSGESMIITDQQGKIEYINPSYSKLTGFQFEEVLGQQCILLEGGNQPEEYYQHVQSTLEQGKVWSASITNQRKDGSEYPALVAISPIFDENKTVTHYVATINDMSEYEILEEKFRQAQKMEAIGTLVGGIAHDFNNTLAGMAGNIFLAKKKAKAFPELLKKLENIEKLGLHAADTVKQLLAFARKGAVEKRVFGLTSFLKETSQLHQSSIPENINFNEVYCDEELIVSADGNQIQQVLLNLINNARDAVAEIANPEISFTLQKADVSTKNFNNKSGVKIQYMAYMQVSDNGLGISQENQERIFEPFFTTKEFGIGTGLGLAMVYGTIQRHGGFIEVESEHGKGTTFHIYLPLQDAIISEAYEAEGTDYLTGSGELILIVDDNENVRESAREVLESSGYQVIEACDGLDAVAKFKEHQQAIALIIMDVVMPKLGGVAAAKQIRVLAPEVKIIFSSGYDNEQILEQADDEAVTLKKPYLIDALLSTVRQQIDR